MLLVPGSEAAVLHQHHSSLSPRAQSVIHPYGPSCQAVCFHRKPKRRQITYSQLLSCMQLGAAASLILTKPAYAPDSTHDILSKPAYAPDTLKDTLGWKASSPDSHSRRLRSYLPDDHDISGKVRMVHAVLALHSAHVLVRWDGPAAHPCHTVLSIVSTHGLLPGNVRV